MKFYQVSFVIACASAAQVVLLEDDNITMTLEYTVEDCELIFTSSITWNSNESFENISETAGQGSMVSQTIFITDPAEEMTPDDMMYLETMSWFLTYEPNDYYFSEECTLGGDTQKDEAGADTSNCPWDDDYLTGGIQENGAWVQTGNRDVFEYKDLTDMISLNVAGMFTFIDTRTSGETDVLVSPQSL